MIHNQFMKWAYRSIFLNCSFNNGYCIFHVDSSKFIDCQDLSLGVIQDRTDLESGDWIFMPVDVFGWHAMLSLIAYPFPQFSF
jgi:hypothetical protein